MKVFLFLLVFCPFLAWSNTIYLDQLDTKYMLQDWGSPQLNKSVIGSELSVGGIPYKRGIGTHSVSRFLLQLDGKSTSFSGWVGADDKNDYSCKMEFQLIADRKIIWTSGIVSRGMPAIPFSVSLKGVQQLALLVKEGGDGIMYDHADWINAKFETRGSITPLPVMPEPLHKPRYILTPPLAETPRINGPKVLGVQPGNPVLFRIPATGARPMAFGAINLPSGLSLDTAKGIISGVVPVAGTYNIILTATNARGADSRVLRIEAGQKISLTPPMGWNSWNCWGLQVNEQKIKDATDVMNQKLADHGWSYINIDDGWQAPQRTAAGRLMGNEKFPDFPGLCQYIHQQGLKFGIYSSPGPQTCGGKLGSYQYEQTDADTWAEWGVDYLKYDYCYYNVVAPKPTEALIKAPYVVMRNALDKVKRDMVYCVGYGAPNVWNWGQEAGGNQWRTTRDITDEWNVMVSIGFFQDVCAPAIKPGAYNDPDMLVVGKLGLGWGSKVHDSYLTADEQYTHISLWALQSAPLLIGCDLKDMDDFTLNLLTNDEVIAVDQDPLVMPAKKIVKPEGQIWYKYLEDGSIAVGLFNVDPYFMLWEQQSGAAIQQQQTPFMLQFADLGLSGEFKVRDLWRQQDLGVFGKNFSTQLPYHGVSLLKLTPVQPSVQHSIN